MYYSPKKQISYSFQKHTRSGNAKIPAFLSVIALIVFGILFLIQTDALKVKNVSVKGSDPLLTKELTLYLSSHTPYLFTSLPTTRSELLVMYPRLGDISLRLDVPSRTLIASYTPRAAHFLWCKPQNCYLVDKNGAIFEKSDITQSTLLTKVEDSYFDITKTGTKIPPLYITSLLSIENTLKEKTIAINFIRIEAPFSLETIIDGHVELRFTVQKDINDQLKTLAVFLNSLTPEKLSALSYIDLRIKNRIYYK